MRAIAVVSTMTWFAGVSLLSGNAGGTGSSPEDLRVSINLHEEDALFGGPIPIELKVKNLATRRVGFAFNRENPVGLRFRVTHAASAKSRPTVLSPSIEEPWILLDSGQSFSETLYLNRFVQFEQPGTFEIDYDARLSYSLDANAQREEDVRIASGRGSLKLSLKPASAEALRTRLESVAADLRSADPRDRRGAVEALSHLDTPLCIPFLIRALHADGAELPAVRALSRFDTPEVDQALMTVTAHPDSEVVEQALGILGKRGRVLDDSRVTAMLTTSNANVRYLGMKYLLSQKARRPVLDATVRPLVEDANPEVARLAQEYLSGRGSTDSGHR